ncbi:MAG: PAC2 family protein [Candidatus Kariarchaeaceae archaeon]
MAGTQGDITISGLLNIPKTKIDSIKEYKVVIGFSGFGNVGYLSLTHIVETVEVKSIAYWGNSSWYHKNRLESLLTVYEHAESKTIIVLPRLPVHVSSVPQKYWDELAKEILGWKCNEYIIIGGLREETRHFGSVDWAAYVPSPAWMEKYNRKRTLNDHLPMIGPLSSFISIGSTYELPVLGLLAYCELEEDPSAALVVIAELEKLTGIIIPKKSELVRFDFSFVPNSIIPVNQNIYNETQGPFEEIEEDEDEDDDDMPGYDLNELL